MSLKSVKSKIRSIDKSRQVTKAMESVSAVKMRRAQQRALQVRPFARHALQILRNVTTSGDASAHPLLSPRPVVKTCIVIIGGDKGLAGSFGASLLRTTHTFITEHGLTRDNVALITVGRRVTEHFLQQQYNVLAMYEKWGDKPSYATITPLAHSIELLFKSGAYDEVHIIFTNFVSTLSQKVLVRQLLPISFSAVEDAITSIAPESGKFSEMNRDIKDDRTSEFMTYEPSREAVLTELIPLLFQIQIFHALLESNASEHSARMIAMKNASDNASDIVKRLKQKFNKVRQAAITREVSEIVGGMESMKRSE